MKALLLALAVALAGCNEPAECDEATPCGFGEVCVDGLCSSKTCATSAQCEMEQYCAAGSCTAGCSSDSDCYPGDACNLETTSCEAAACRDSRLDCAYKEFCNGATGECYPASGYYCGACVDDDDCGGNGNICLSWGQYGDFCGVTCEVESDCPSGFTCVEVTDNTGNPLASQCITYCWLYENDDRSAPPRDLPVPIAIGLDDAYEVCEIEVAR